MLPDVPVGTLQKGLELRQRPLDTLPLGGHRSSDPLIAGAVLFQLSEDGDVLFPEDFDLGSEPGQCGGEIGRAEAAGQQLSGELDTPFLHSGQDFGGEAEVIRFLVSITGVDGVRDHGPGCGLGNQFLQPGPLVEPCGDVV